MRPAIGASVASSAAPAMNPPAISPWPPPSSSIRSGTSTSIAPNITEGTATKAAASRIGRLTRVAITSPRLWRSGARDSGSREAAIERRS